jgi:salicylate hydroxylase
VPTTFDIAEMLRPAAADRPQAAAALQRYEAARRERSARIQLASRGNEWMKGPGNADWVYGYDAWQVAIA